MFSCKTILLQETKVSSEANLNHLRIAVVDDLTDTVLAVNKRILLLEKVKLLADNLLRSLLNRSRIFRRRIAASVVRYDLCEERFLLLVGIFRKMLKEFRILRIPLARRFRHTLGGCGSVAQVYLMILFGSGAVYFAEKEA